MKRCESWIEQIVAITRKKDMIVDRHEFALNEEEMIVTNHQKVDNPTPSLSSGICRTCDFNNACIWQTTRSGGNIQYCEQYQ